MASLMYCLVLSVLLLASQLYGTEAVFKGYSTIEAQEVGTSTDTYKVHIVYMGGVSEMTTTNNVESHRAMLQAAMGSLEDVSHRILYSYTKSFNGFAAVCSDKHAESISGMNGVVSVFKAQTYKTQTTDSWKFLGLTPTQGLWPESNFGNDTIVGMIDTGVWPESKSFQDDGFGPIPARWKGACVAGQNFTASLCNKKLIGAKYYYKGLENETGPIQPPEIKSARDQQGHGTHTSSTAAGRTVPNASVLGVGNGTATGGAPLARVAMYKACWFGSCSEADLLAAFEDAIADGVDLLSVSIGGPPVDYMNDSIAIGAFHAVAKGIVVSCAAGNSGPYEGTVVNSAPWIFTVAASTINRVYQSDVQIGKNMTLPGIAINSFKMNATYPVVYAGDIVADTSGTASCSSSLNATKANGTIILCEGQVSLFTDFSIQSVGGMGYIAITTLDTSVQFLTGMPSTNVDNRTGNTILKYARSKRHLKAKILPSIKLFNTSAASTNIAYFSSVGPNSVTPGIQKPDIAAPGVDILAAWSPIANPTEETGDSRKLDFNIISGTSMATPHVSGLVALLKSFHPDWSPAAIKSAIMTTATPLNQSISGNDPTASGSGHINPTRAADPGLVLNLTTKDYTNFLCSIGYTPAQVALVSGRNETCPKTLPTVQDLNYPSILFISNLTLGYLHNTTRTVTNVGPALSNYTVTVESPVGAMVHVEPGTLTFSRINEEQSFSVFLTVTNSTVPTQTYHNYGSITWSDSPNSHVVRLVIGYSTGLLLSQ
ncbi:unnamed protein product [Calypogeia fissa]